MRFLRMRALLATLATVGALSLVAAADADARTGRGSSFGSRGAKTYTAPPATATTPGTARPMERSMTQQPAAVNRPGTGAAAGGGMFSRSGLLGGLAAGFLGAGLFGLLFGGSLFGGLGGLASILGLLIQVALVVIVARLAWTWWQRRNGSQPAYAGGAPRTAAQAPGAPGALARMGLGSLGGGAAQTAGTAGAAPMAAGIAFGKADLSAADFDAFEKLLGEIQDAYGREDREALRARVTPEMMSYFSEELADNATRGVRNELSGVKLLQGDLSEAWREGDAEYATVAMRYAIVDRTVDRASGRVVEGDAEHPVEVTELWTFTRERSGPWLLSAIQQVS